MRLRTFLRTGAAVAALSLTLTACGGGSGGGSGESLVDVAKNDKKLVVGIKVDQPGLGQKKPDGSYAGFDVDVAKYVAKELGVDEQNIEFTEAPSKQRENMIKKGDVDYIVATYSITEKREKEVDFAGPYLITGQGLLVKKDNTSITGPESLNGKRLCSVTGSTPAQNIQEEYADKVQLKNYDTYSQCVNALKNGAIDAVTTDEIILAGYAAQNGDALKLVGKPFTKENYGIGLRKGDTKGKEALNNAIKKMIDSGAWAESLKKNAPSYQIPSPPTIGKIEE